VSQKRILGFTDGGMVPYSHSETSVKERCAAVQQPFGSTAAWPVATWDQARACIAAILHTAEGPEPGVITISNVKRLFRSRFGLDLSETALGHSRLTDLLQDPRLHDICRVEVRGTGHCVVCRIASPEESFVWLSAEECASTEWWNPQVWKGAVDASAVESPEVAWDMWQPFIPVYPDMVAEDLAAHGLEAAHAAASPAFDLPSEFLAAPPGLSFEAWQECQPLEPMKVPLSEHMLAAHHSTLSEFQEVAGQVAFLNFEEQGHKEVDAPRSRRELQRRPQNHRSRSVSTSPGSEHVYAVDSDCSGHEVGRPGTPEVVGM